MMAGITDFAMGQNRDGITVGRFTGCWDGQGVQKSRKVSDMGGKSLWNDVSQGSHYYSGGRTSSKSHLLVQ